jgi:hypothetical protein
VRSQSSRTWSGTELHDFPTLQCSAPHSGEHARHDHVDVRPITGRLTGSPSDLSSRDDTGTAVPLVARAPPIPDQADRDATVVTVAGTFRSRAAQLTWRHHGAVLAIWTFNIELD